MSLTSSSNLETFLAYMLCHACFDDDDAQKGRFCNGEAWDSRQMTSMIAFRCNSSNHSSLSRGRRADLQLINALSAVHSANCHFGVQTVDVAEVFVGGIPGHYLYNLNSMVCYYGLHYQAFVKDGESGVWQMFDDTTASEVSTVYMKRGGGGVYASNSNIVSHITRRLSWAGRKSLTGAALAAYPSLWMFAGNKHQ